MATYERLTLGRDCEAIEIPAGQRVTLPAGTAVTLTQALGGSYTVMTDEGYLFRIAEKDADALGKAREAGAAAEVPLEGEALERAIWDRMRTCYDPEIPVNIVDLGLVYRCDITPLPDGGSRVEVDLTLTAPGCGMGPILQADVQEKILGVPGVREADVRVVFEPAWDPSRMSEAARLELGML